MRVFFKMLFFILLVAAMISVACIGGGDGWRSSQQTQAAEQAGDNSTATFGSNEFKTQLTLSAEGDK